MSPDMLMNHGLHWDSQNGVSSIVGYKPRLRVLVPWFAYRPCSCGSPAVLSLIMRRTASASHKRFGVLTILYASDQICCQVAPKGHVSLRSEHTSRQLYAKGRKVLCDRPRVQGQSCLPLCCGDYDRPPGYLASYCMKRTRSRINLVCASSVMCHLGGPT
nr:hypothetical protein CFP56_03271 [Quercus suber]